MKIMPQFCIVVSDNLAILKSSQGGRKMNKIRTALLCSFVALIAVIGFNGLALAAKPGPTTHMGVRASDHVTLKRLDDTAAGSTRFKRSFPDGSSGATEFVVPSDKSLVVTDVGWWATTSDGSVDWVLHFLIIDAGVPPISSGGPSISFTLPSLLDLPSSFPSSAKLVQANNSSAQIATANHALTSGFIVGPNLRLRAIFLGLSSQQGATVVHGYLIDAAP